MSLFLDNLWIWFVLTFVVGLCCWIWFLCDQKGRNLVIAILAPILTLVLGLTLYYGVDTDRKSIIRMIDALIAAVEADDYKAVCQFISPNAVDIQILAEAQMNLVSISEGKYHDLEIEITSAAPTRTAKVRFGSIFHWKSKVPIDGMFIEQPIPDIVRFEIELVKTKDKSWQLTDNFQFFPLRNFQ